LNSSDEVIPVFATQRLNENVSASVGAVCQVRSLHTLHSIYDVVKTFSHWLVYYTSALPI